VSLLHSLLRQFVEAIRDLAPVVIVIAVFQLLVIRQPLPAEVSLADLLLGLVSVILGLTLFIKGLQIGLFPVGEGLAHAFARKASVFWLLLFSFALGFGTTIAEPALTAVASKAASVMSGAGLIGAESADHRRFAITLRLVVALSVGSAVVLGVLRILKGWPLHYLIITGYALVLLLTGLAPDEIIGIAYDSGGVTTSTITVPLVAALGVGLATAIKGRNPMLDGFGLIAFASVMPIIFVLLFGLVGLHGVAP
jgi:hypothetical protein